MSAPERDDSLAEQLRLATEVLEAIVRDLALLGELSEEERTAREPVPV